MNNENFNKVRQNCSEVCRRVEVIGGEAILPRTAEPASENDIQSVERELGVTLPKSLRSFFSTNTRHFSCRWFLPIDSNLPTRIKDVFCADIFLNLDFIPQIETTRRGWVESVFPDVSDTYDRVWHDKLAFLEVGNGDFWAFDLNSPGGEHIVYLSHDDGEGHGAVIGTCFETLLQNWSAVGCAGCDDHAWLTFWNATSAQLDPNGQNAVEFRNYLGMAK